MKILKKHWQQLAWSITSFLLAVVVSFASSHVQATTTIAPSPQVVSSSSIAGSRTAFAPVADSHLEPNFYR